MIKINNNLDEISKTFIMKYMDENRIDYKNKDLFGSQDVWENYDKEYIEKFFKIKLNSIKLKKIDLYFDSFFSKDRIINFEVICIIDSLNNNDIHCILIQDNKLQKIVKIYNV